MAIVKRGKAQFTGIPGSFDVILYPTQQTMKAVQEWEEEVLKDASGGEAAWNARNENFKADVMFKLLGDTGAHAIAGAAFLAPYASITLSGFDASFWNAIWRNESGDSIDLFNDKVGDFNLKMKKYADSTQNTLANATPA